MKRLHDQVIFDYLRPSELCGWMWEENGKSISWNNGRTLIFTAELQGCMAELDESHFPSFHALILVSAACSRSWSVSGERLLSDQRISDLLADRPEVWQAVSKSLHEVHKLHFSQQGILKRDIIQALFAVGSQTIAAHQATNVQQYVQAELPNEDIAALPPSRDASLLREAFFELAVIFADIDIESLATRVQTGLDTPPEPSAAAALPIFERLQQMLGDLRDSEWSELVPLVEQLRPAVCLPRKISEPQELRDGGVSDLSNRGNPDKLLLSELAHDDDVLMARLALREALFLEREQPRHAQHATRNVYIESSIRMWGMPRVFATAIALALGLDSRGEVEWFRVTGPHSSPCDLADRDQLFTHLAQLDPEPRIEPGFSPTTSSESVLILHQQAMKDPLVVSLLQELIGDIQFIITVTNTGNCELLRWSAAGALRLRAARIDVSNIGEQLSKSPQDRETLSILLEHSFPARIPQKPNVDLVQWDAQRQIVYSVTPHGSPMLLAFDRPGRAGRLLARIQQACLERWFPRISAHRAVIVGFASTEKALVVKVVELASEDSYEIRIPQSVAPMNCAVFEEYLVVIERTVLNCYRLLDGVQTDKKSVNIESCFEPNHLSQGGHWYRIGITAEGSIRLLALTSTVPVLGFFTLPNMQSAAICTDGTIRVDGEEHFSLGQPKSLEYYKPLWINSAGNFLLLSGRSSNPICWLIDVHQQASRSVPSTQPSLRDVLPSSAHQYLPRKLPSLRNKFQAIGLSSDMVLTLVNPKGNFLQLILNSNTPMWKNVLRRDATNAQHRITFEQMNAIAHPQIPSYQLRYARIDETLECWLDPLGFLYLHRAGSINQSLCLSVNDGEALVSTSTGKSWGRTALVLDDRNKDALECLRAVVRDGQ